MFAPVIRLVFHIRPEGADDVPFHPCIPRARPPSVGGNVEGLPGLARRAHAGPPLADTAPAAPLDWQAAATAIKSRGATCAQLAAGDSGSVNEFDAHECEAQLPDLRARADAVLAAGLWYTSTIEVWVGDYDFATHTFALTTQPISLVRIEPSLCPGVVAATWDACLFVGAPKKASINATVSVGAGMYPSSQRRTQIIAAWPLRSEVFPDELAREVPRTDSLRAATTFRWSWSADRCVAATSTAYGYCWGAESVSVAVQWPWDVRDALSKAAGP